MNILIAINVNSIRKRKKKGMKGGGKRIKDGGCLEESNKTGPYK